MKRAICRGNLVALLVLAAIATLFWQPGPVWAAFVRFAHPQADDTIRAGHTIEVTVVSIGAAWPADIVLEITEDGVTFFQLDATVAGRAITADYTPPNAPGSSIAIRTRSAINSTFNFQIQVFLE